MQQYFNIPAELRALRQWVCWRSVEREGGKPTKQPLNPRTGHLASVTNPADWGTFEEAVAASVHCDGIGFVFTRNDPYFGIDLDDTHGDAEAYARQIRVFREFNSYAELSPSGRGLHIIGKGKLPGAGRRRASIELYDCERYFTFTGNVHHNVPIAERQDLVNLLYEQMGGPAQLYVYGQDQEQKCEDAEIIERASNAANGDKFCALLTGDWRGLGYPSQSEADFAFVDIVAFYTQNRAQIARIYRASALGQSPKDNYKHRGDRHAYVAYMIEKSFDRQLPPVDTAGLQIAWEKLQAERAAKAAGGGSEGKSSANPSDPPAAQLTEGNASAADAETSGRSFTVSTFPAGLIGEIAQFIYEASPRPVMEIAYVGAIGLLAGITGRAYNISGTGLNQYLLCIAETGRGKEAIASGIAKLVDAVYASVPSVLDFRGPVEIASPQAILKWLAKKPCVYSIVGEFGIRLKEMSSPQANPNTSGLKRVLLDLYNKSGKGNTLGSMAYSKAEDNTAVVASPSFTLIGESTPSRFFENISEDVVSDGLLPRFTVVEFRGIRVPFNRNHKIAVPTFALVNSLAAVVAHCQSLQSLGKCYEIPMTPEAEAIFDRFNVYCDTQINDTRASVVAHELWNRAHIKAMKLAGLMAVGENYISPQVTAAHAQRATDELHAQTIALKTRFDNGEIGLGAINPGALEAKQTDFMVRVIAEWACKPWEQSAIKYRIPQEMWKRKVFPYNSLVTRLSVQMPFKNDRRGPVEAIRRTYQMLLDNDDLREVPKEQNYKDFGRRCRAFAISNAERFLED